jgi:L-malate glycosyltransferase
LNILHLHTGLNLTCGISKTIYLISKNKSPNSHQVLAIEGDAVSKFREANIKVDLLNINRCTLTGIIKSARYIMKYVRGNNIQILHSHHRYFDLISYLVSFFCKVKRITSVQSFVYRRKLFSYKSEMLLAAGESVKKHLIDYFGINEKKINVFNNFVDTAEIPVRDNSVEIKKELNVPERAYIVGYAGRYSVKEKGIDILISAYKLFKEKHIDAILVMVGGGEDIKKIKDLPDDILILESRKNIFDYYKIFDCLVLPSRVDPFPLTALEAGMMRIPFIGSDVNGISEIIKDGKDGLLFEKENIGMLLEKLEKYYKDRDFAKSCADNLYNKISVKYNSDSAIKKLNKIYEDI